MLMCKIFLLALLGTVMIFGHPVSDSEVATEFGKFVKQYHTHYDSIEETVKRYNIFADNYRKIVEHNLVDKEVKLAVNQFADMTEEEFRTYLGHRKPTYPLVCTYIHNKPYGEIKKVLDWREKNVVTRVKYQANCGSCWAFATVGALESLHAIKTGELVEFSEQELVDCTHEKPYENNGCDGGYVQSAFNYVRACGISKESEYQYVAKVQKCNKQSNSFSTSGCAWVSSGDNDKLLEALNIEPVAVGVSAANFKFRFYSSGIIKKNCGENRILDHGVLLVGAAIESSTGTPYWIVKNSWGANWGEYGYVYIMRSSGKDQSVCKIAESASYPIY